MRTDATPNYRNWNKVRVIALYIQHRDGVSDEDRRRLFQHARLSLAEQDAINALTYLGVRITRVGFVFTSTILVINGAGAGTQRSRHKKEAQAKV